jgi:hypothetical protein
VRTHLVFVAKSRPPPPRIVARARLALAGDSARAALEGAAAVSLALGTESLRQAVSVLLRMQRVGFLDFHGIVAADATLALRCGGCVSEVALRHV